MAACGARCWCGPSDGAVQGKVAFLSSDQTELGQPEKLTEILRENDIKSVTIVRMEVLCCGGLELAAKKALQVSGKFIPWQVVTLSLDGKIIDS